jgi:hypothetical protein
MIRMYGVQKLSRGAGAYMMPPIVRNSFVGMQDVLGPRSLT